MMKIMGRQEDKKMSATPSFVICCDESPPDLLSSTEHFPCVKASLDSANLTWRAKAVLSGNLETVNVSDLPSVGAIGCAESHIALWRKLVSSRHDKFLIFEDDAKLMRSEEEIQSVIDKAEGGYDVLLLGWRLPVDTLFQKRTSRVDDTFATLEADRFYETHAYVITKKAAAALLKDATPIEVQIDAYMGAKRKELGLRFLLLKGGPIVNQRRSIFDSSVQSAVMDHCAVCRLPRQMRSGWFAAAFLSILILLVSVLILVRRPLR